MQKIYHAIFFIKFSSKYISLLQIIIVLNYWSTIIWKMKKANHLRMKVVDLLCGPAQLTEIS